MLLLYIPVIIIIT